MIKELRFFPMVIFILTLRVEAQDWVKKSPSPTGENLNSVYFTDPSIGYAVGNSGTIFKTTDGGNSWGPEISGTTENLHSVFFPTPNTGYAVGNAGIILNTIDGGITWNRQRAITTNLNAVFFLNDALGFAVGSGAVIIKTVDGGNTWHSLPNTSKTISILASENTEITSVFFFDSTNGLLATSSGMVFRTSDGGNNWTGNYVYQVEGYDRKSFSLDFSDPKKGFLAGWASPVYSTVDSGRTWVKYSATLPGGTNAFAFSSIDNGVAVGDRGSIIPFGTGGLGFIIKGFDTTITLNSINFPGKKDTGYVVGDNGLIIKTTDHGASWVLKSRGTGSAMRSVFSLDSNLSFAVGENGLIRKTQDGWKTWTDLSSGTSKTLISVFFNDPYEGWVIANDGTLFHTVNSGDIWTISNSPVDPISAGLILHKSFKPFFGINNPSLELGVNFNSPMTYPFIGKDFLSVNAGLVSIYFLHVDTIFVMAYDPNLSPASLGKLSRSTDGGKTWTVQPIGLKGPGYSIYFVNSKLGFIVGYNGDIFKTSDGGTTWVSKQSSTNNRLNSVAFLDEKSGYAVGFMGVISKTNDGGDTWTIQPSGVNQELFSIQFPTPTTGFIVGASGTILKAILSPASTSVKSSNQNQSKSLSFICGGQSTINFKFLSEGSPIELSMVDMRGKNIWSKILGLSNDPHEITWDGIASNGRPAPAGIYVIRAKIMDGNRNSGSWIMRKMVYTH